MASHWECLTVLCDRCCDVRRPCPGCEFTDNEYDKLLVALDPDSGGAVQNEVFARFVDGAAAAAGATTHLAAARAPRMRKYKGGSRFLFAFMI